MHILVCNAAANQAFLHSFNPKQGFLLGEKMPQFSKKWYKDCRKPFLGGGGLGLGMGLVAEESACIVAIERRIHADARRLKDLRHLVLAIPPASQCMTLMRIVFLPETCGHIRPTRQLFRLHPKALLGLVFFLKPCNTGPVRRMTKLRHSDVTLLTTHLGLCG
jgi:hypothetical protein